MNKKYPKSKNNMQCLTPCFKANTWILHPITLEYITNTNTAFCPVKEWTYTDPKTKKKNIFDQDECINSLDISNEINYDNNNFIIPNNDMDCKDFLKLYYNIDSIENACIYINNNSNIPFFTKRRIINCSFTEYGKFLNEISDDIIKSYIYISQNYWIENIYNSIYKYIKINTKGEIKLYKIDNKIKNTNQKQIKIKYIKNKFLNYENILKFLKYYVKNYSSVKDNKFLKNQEEKIIEYLINKINNTV